MKQLISKLMKLGQELGVGGAMLVERGLGNDRKDYVPQTQTLTIVLIT